MRNVCCNVLSGSDRANTNGIQIDANQLVTGSFQFIFGDSTAGGTGLIQASNDPCAYSNVAYDFVVQNWTTISGASTTISAGASGLITLANLNYRWLRATYASTAAGIQTISPIADTGIKQIQTITTIGDTGVTEITDITCANDIGGSLNSTYFIFSTMVSGGASQNGYYVWYDNGTGIDPAVPSRTGIHITYTNDDTAPTIATLTRAALTSAVSATATITGSTTHAIITNNFMGNATNAANGTASPGFTYSITPGVASNTLNTVILLSSINLSTKVQKNFYFYFNTNSEGVDPALSGKTAIPIVVATSATANAIATSMRSAISALTNDFASSGSNAVVTIANLAAGPVTSMAQGSPASPFSFSALTTGVASNLINKYFLLSDASDVNKYAIWMNVDSIGTAPVVSGYTSSAVVFSSGSTAGTVGTAIATIIAALNSTNSFTATGTTLVTVTNKVGGPFTPIVDGTPPTGFTFAVTGGGTSTVNCNMNAMSI